VGLSLCCGHSPSFGDGRNIVICTDVFGPANDKIFGECTNGRTWKDLRLDRTGRYVIRVSGSPSSYQLVIDRIQPVSPSATAIKFGQTLTQEINPAADVDYFYFNGISGDSVTVRVPAGHSPSFGNASNVVFYAELFGPSGEKLAEQSTNAGPRLEVKLRETGPHVLRVSSNSIWGYPVDLQCLGQCPPFEASSPTTVKVVPQFVYGGGWYSALYFGNTSDHPASVRIEFIGDDGKPMNLPSIGASSGTVNLASGGSASIEAPNVGALTKQGYISVSMPDGVQAHALFRRSVEGSPDQEAIVPLSGTSATKSTLLWDETGLATAVAVVNPTSVDAVISVVVRDASGRTMGNGSILLAAKNHTATFLRDIQGVGDIAGKRGSVDFIARTGGLAVLGLRVRAQAFSPIPTLDR
jgi:hypothetical protein